MIMRRKWIGLPAAVAIAPSRGKRGKRGKRDNHLSRELFVRGRQHERAADSRRCRGRSTPPTGRSTARRTTSPLTTASSSILSTNLF